MLRARRLVLLQQQQQYVAQSTGLRSLTALTTTRSRFSSIATRVRHGNSNVVVRRAPATLQARWRSAMTSEQEDALAKHMEELIAFRDSGNWRQALQLLDRVDRQGYALNSTMYEHAMAACARMGKIEVLPGLMQNMEVDSLLPTSRTIDFVMQAYIAAEEWEHIVTLARDMTAKGVPLSEAAFQAAFEACGKIRDAKSARHIIQNVEKDEQFPLTAAHYAAAMRACGMGGRADYAASLFAHMELRGIDADADAFNQLIRAQIVNKDRAQALQSFLAVRERGLALPESIYTATIDALVTHGEFWQAVQLFNQMLAMELAPSVFCLGRMMVAYVRLHKHDDARACWDQIVAIDEAAPSLMKYAKMVTELAATNDSGITIQVFEHLFPRFDHDKIRDSTYAAAIRAYGRLGQAQTAIDLFDAFVASRARARLPMPTTAGIYVAVFNAISRDTTRDPQDNTRDAKRVWDLMVEHVPVILAPAYASLAGVLASSGDIGTLEELLAHATARQLVDLNADDSDESDGEDDPRQPQGHAHDDHDEDADPAAAWSSMRENELLLNGVISGLSKARHDESARVVEYLDMMQTQQMAIKDSVIRAATDTFVKHKHWKKMRELLKYMDVETLDNPDVCFGDTISKLLDAEAWEVARLWISSAHRLGVSPPIRGKLDILVRLRALESSEWQIAYALARETLSFKSMIQENLECVADAVHVCSNALRTDLVVKMYDWVVMHPSLSRFKPTARHPEPPQIPLRMFKQTLLACMREHNATDSSMDEYIHKAETVCTHMLQSHKRAVLQDGDALSMAISIKATLGDDDDVLALFETMQQQDVTPNSYAYNAAIAAYSRRRQVDKVLVLRDELLAMTSSILEERSVLHSLLFSLAIVPDDATLRRHVDETLALLPHITTDQVVQAFVHANRPHYAVEYFDPSVSESVFYTTLRRLLDPSRHDLPHSSNITCSAELLLKFVAFHGLDRVRPPGLILKTTKRLIEAGCLDQARAILELYYDPACEVALSDMKPSFQREVLEMLLYIYGEQGNTEALVGLLGKKRPSVSATTPTPVALTVRHYQLAMEYCTRLDAKKGALACLQLFESLRMQYVKPNGSVYLLALQSSRQLDRLEETGARVLQDAKDQGFHRLVAQELFRLANLAVYERRATQKDDDDNETIETRAKRGRGRPRKGSDVESVAVEPMSVHEVNVTELVELALFCHHMDVTMSAKLASKLLELDTHLPQSVKLELEHIRNEAQDQPTPRKPTTTTTTTYGRRHVSPRRPTRPPSSSSSYNKTTTGTAGARWGQMYLQKKD